MTRPDLALAALSTALFTAAAWCIRWAVREARAER